MASTTIRLGSHGQAASLQSVLVRAMTVAQLWRERARQRRQLAESTPEMLDDMGIDALQAREESMKPFWVV